MGSLGSSLPVGRMSRFNVQMQDFSSSTYECIGRAFERLLWTLGSGAEGDAMSCWENCWESGWRGSARKRQEGQETFQYGRATCREGVCDDVSSGGGAVTVRKKKRIARK